MACIVLEVRNDKTFKEDKTLKDKKFTSHRKLAAKLKPGQTADVRETSGMWDGWYRQVGVEKDGKTYWMSRPLMEI